MIKDLFVFNSVIYKWGGFQNITLKDKLLLYIFWVDPENVLKSKISKEGNISTMLLIIGFGNKGDILS